MKRLGGRSARVGSFLSVLFLLLGCAGLEGATLYTRGTEALDRGDFEAATIDLERAALASPRSSSIQNHLGIAYAQSGRREAARRAFERAVALDCSNTAARQNLDRLEAASTRGSEPLPDVEFTLDEAHAGSVPASESICAEP